MAIVKGIGGWYFHSKALTADAIHSLTEPGIGRDDTCDGVVGIATARVMNFLLAMAKWRAWDPWVSAVYCSWGGLLMGWSAIMSLAQELVPGFSVLAENLGLLGHTHSHGAVDDLGPKHQCGMACWGIHLNQRMAISSESVISIHFLVDSLTYHSK